MTNLSLSAKDTATLRQRLHQVEAHLNQVILGKAEVIEHLLVALLARGHVLLEDIPGLGKTTLAKAFAQSLHCKFRRMQFTPDLLPSDVLGTSIYNPGDQNFHFQEGPIFTQIFMADEINRASPRTQSSLLEAMAEGQVSVEGEQRLLTTPFLVIATQNPIEYQGTYPLPEAQLDRFLLALTLGYPEPEYELQMLYQSAYRPLAPQDQLLPAEVLALQEQVNAIRLHEDLARYILKIVHATREQADRVKLGASPRATRDLFQSAKARALLKGREFVTPEDIQVLAAPVLSHRLVMQGQGLQQSLSARQWVTEMVQSIAPPR
jgi:MoxR-like ATPase